MLKALSLLVLLSVGAAPAPSVQGVSVPRRAVTGAPWRAVVAVAPPGRYVNQWEPKRIQRLTAAGKLVPVARG